MSGGWGEGMPISGPLVEVAHARAVSEFSFMTINPSRRNSDVYIDANLVGGTTTIIYDAETRAGNRCLLECWGN